MNVLSGGFTDAPRQSATAFRTIMDVMARPGLQADLTSAAPPAPLSPAAGAIILTLADPNSPVHLAGEMDCEAVRAWITFHTGAPFVPATEAALAIGTWDALQPLDRFAIGTPEYPDRSAALIVEMGALPAPNARLTGPGIKGEAQGFCPGTRPVSFPLGLDLILTAGTTITAIPRSTEVEFF